MTRDGRRNKRSGMRHRNSQKRIYLENAISFVTTKTKGNFAYFRYPAFAQLCMEKIFFSQRIISFRLYGFVILADHLHLLVQPQRTTTISTVMHCIKRNVSRSINILLARHVDVDDHPRLRFQWHPSFHDHIIRNQKDFNTHIEYIRHNPVKHGYAKKGEAYPFLWVDNTRAYQADKLSQCGGDVFFPLTF